MYAQAAIKPNTLLRNGAYGIVMRGVQKCTRGCSSLRDRKRLPLCCIKLDTATDPACGSGGMFVQTGDFVNQWGLEANSSMTFYGQEKVEYNAQLCLMNMAVHGLTGVIRSGDEANTFYHDTFNLEGKCDYVMANPPFNVDKVKEESAISAGRLPFGQPGVNKQGEFGNANYLWISYFYAYLNQKGRAGFVMASSATDSTRKDKEMREKLVETGHVDVMISVANNFFYTKSLPCTLWFFDKGKSDTLQDKVLFIDARNYYTQVDRTLNEWSEWQLKNLNAIVWLYRGEIDKYVKLQQEYRQAFQNYAFEIWNDEIAAALNDNEASYAEIVQKLEKIKEEQVALSKGMIEGAEKREKKQIQSEWDARFALLDEIITVVKDADWLYQRFADGVYDNIPGLCKVASRAEIKEKGYSLTPGTYVGTAPVEDDGVDFTERMREIHQELLTLQKESNDLIDKISKDLEEMGL